MPDVSKIKLPDNSELNIKDARIPGVDSTPTSGSSNLVTSGGVYNSVNEVSLVAATALNELNDRVTDLENTTSSGGEESDNIFYYTVSNIYSPTANELNGLYDLADAVLTDGNVPSLVLTDGTDTILYLFNYYEPNTEIDFIWDSGVEYTMIWLYEDGTLDAETYDVYRKPSTGIPASDLASGVIPTVNNSTITVQMNGSTVDTFTTNASSNKIIDLGTVITSHQTLPTISTNVATDKADNTKVAGAKAVYDEVHPAVVSSQPAGGFAPNILYDLGTITGTVTFTMASPSDATIINHYYWTFETSSTAPTITWPTGITSWNGGSAPTIAASKHYEISVLDGVGCYLEV